MAFNRNANQRRNFGAGYGRNISPWEAANSIRGQEALALANNLISNLLRNQQHAPPSLLEIAARNRYDGGYGYESYDRVSAPLNSDQPTLKLTEFCFSTQLANRNGTNNRNGNNRRATRGIRKPDSKNRSKNILAKGVGNGSKDEKDETETEKKSDESSDKENTKKAEEKKDKKDDSKLSPYANIPNDMFYCHLCTKHMWDALSFENHLKGRTHQMMKEGIEESYRLKANMIRQEAKIAEQLKAIEIDRLKRLGKTIRASNQHREYCIMCDLHFYGHLSTHRKSDGHLNLKKFLHPKCNDCNFEFHNRSEYDEHLLSPSHLRNSKTKPTSKSEERKKNQLHILKEADELQGLREEKKKEKKKPEADKAEVKSEDAVENGEKAEAMDAEEVDKKEEEEEDEAPAEESADVILDFVDGITLVEAEIDTKLPKYNCNRPVAPSMIHKLQCFECRLCAKYLDTEKTAEIHSRTTAHHRNFLKFLNEKANETKIAQKRAAAALEESERKKIKTDTDEDAKDTKNGELYDPVEATADDEENSTLYLDADDIKAGEITEGDTTFEEATSNGLLNEDDKKDDESSKRDDASDDEGNSSKSGNRATRRRTRAGKF